MSAPLIDIHTHSPKQNGAIEMISVSLLKPVIPHPAPPAICCAAIHPWDIAAINPSDIDLILNELNTNTSIRAIGETGLDYYIINANPAAQQLIFELQLEIAQTRNLPVIIHCVKAFEPVMATLSRYNLPGVIFHGFIGSRQQAEIAVREGYFLSFGERSLKSPKTMDAVKLTPTDHIFFETDDSQISIASIYDEASNIISIDREMLTEAIYQNYKTLFE